MPYVMSTHKNHKLYADAEKIDTARHSNLSLLGACVASMIKLPTIDNETAPWFHTRAFVRTI